MKRIFITLLVLAVILSAGIYFLVLKAITPDELPVKVVNAEEVMATSGTIAIASLDMSFVRRINKMFNAKEDPSPLSVAKSTESKTEKTFLEKLTEQGVNLVSETDYALATINLTQEVPSYSFVLFGRFSKAKLKQAIRQQYLVDESAESYILITEKVEDEIKDPCAAPSKKSAPKQHALHLKNDRILLSSPELMPVLLKRFAEKARAGISLDKWRQFRKDKAMAGALMSPDEAKKGAVDFPSALLLGALSKQPLIEIYAGTVVSLIPKRGFKFLIDAHSKEVSWPLEVKTKYDAWLDEAMLDLKDMPTLSSLLQSLDVQADGSILRFKTIADRKTLDNLEKIPAEFLQMAFSGAFGDSKESGPAGEEQVVKDSEIEKYKLDFDFSSIPPFDAKASLHKPDSITGPFAVRLKKIGLLDTDDSVIELEINAEGKGFENLSGELMHKSTDSPETSVAILSVEDIEGNNLLREEQCGRTRNLIASSLNTMRDKEYVNNEWISKSMKLQGSKSVRLKSNVLLSQVVKIKGKIAVQAATQTSVQTLQPPFSGKTIETEKVRMYLRKNTPSTVKYTLSGDLSHILAVRARNAQGQYLADAGSSASGDEIKMVSKRFKGKVASIEVVVAEQIQSKDYPFEINQITPRYGKEGDGKVLEMTATSKRQFLKKFSKVEYNNECKDKQQAKLGAFLLCLKKFGDRWGRETGGEFDVIAPYDEALQNDISAGVVRIDTVVTESGEKIPFTKSEKINFIYKFDSRYNNKEKKWEIINRKLSDTNVNVFSDKEELKNKKISKVMGTLTIRLPRRSSYFELGATDLGVVKKSDDGISANIAAFEDWHTYIDLQGSVDKIMRFMPLAKDGSVLNTDNFRINEKKYSSWGLSNEEKERIKALPEKWQGMVTIYGKPELIRIIYANDFETIEHKFEFLIN